MAHRDIEPLNIFLTQGTNCKLGDLGLLAELPAGQDYVETNGLTQFVRDVAASSGEGGALGATGTDDGAGAKDQGVSVCGASG
jgi:serine/threonine protein kinase